MKTAGVKFFTRETDKTHGGGKIIPNNVQAKKAARKHLYFLEKYVIIIKEKNES